MVLDKVAAVGYSNNDGFIGEYQREVDDIFYYAQVNTIQKLRDSKLQDIRVDNNVGIKGEVPSSLLTMQTKMSNGIDKDKIGLEDLFGFGRISEAMHKEYEDIKAEVDAYNASLPQYSSKNSSKFLPDFISKFIFDAKIDRVKIDSYDEYINKMVTQSDFDYETDGERMLSIGGYFVPLFGQYKMLAEIVDGKDLISGRRYSVGEQLFAISIMGTGSVIGKAYKGVKAGLASGVEETSSKVEGTVLAMNGARDSSGIEKLAKSITEKIAGKTSYVKSSEISEETGKVVRDGSTRAAEYSSNWPSGSLKETINKFTPNSETLITEKGKMIYTNDETGIQVVYDTKGNYFRIEDTSIPRGRNYLDLEGNDMNNKTIDGKQMGRNKKEYQSVTHFNNLD